MTANSVRTARLGLLFLVASIYLFPSSALCDDHSARLILDTAYVAKINEAIPVTVYISNAPNKRVNITLSANTSLAHYSEKRFTLHGAEKKFVTVTFKGLPPSGLAYVYADTDNADDYEQAWNLINLGFEGHLKPTWSEPLTYDAATTLSLSIADKDGKPVPFQGNLDLRLQSADGILDKHPDATGVVHTIQQGSQTSPQFQLQPRFARGGNVHLTATLTHHDIANVVLAQDEFVFTAQPAWWLPVVLALLGGLLHAIYKLVRTPEDRTVSAHVVLATVITSLVAAFLGYLFANFDLLGLKLDPNVLRTYPLVGFLFSYIGIEALLSDKLSRLGAKGQTEGEEQVGVKGKDDAKPVLTPG